MTPNILYSKSKFHWLRDYPEDDPDYYCESGDCMLCDLTCTERKKNYDQAVAKSLASAIEFVEEDQYKIKVECFTDWWFKSNGEVALIGEDFMNWTPTDGQLFTVEGIEVEIESQYRSSLVEGNWHKLESYMAWGEEPDDFEYRQVVRLKAKSDGQTNVDEYHDAAGRITREEFYTGIKPKDLKAKPERKGEDMQRWFTCETCNGLGRITQQQYNSIYPKDSAPPEPKGEESLTQIKATEEKLWKECQTYFEHQLILRRGIKELFDDLKSEFHLTRRIDTLKENSENEKQG